jgi:hypothetical protein
MGEVPFKVGALYSRKGDIHGLLGGQQQGGISTPARSPFVVIFTGEAGKTHGYDDFWDDDGIFHYFGEGQSGDMRLVGGNRAVLAHQEDGKQLLLFQMMGRGQPYRYLGEFRVLDCYEMPNIPDTAGHPRTAIIFRLRPIDTPYDQIADSAVDLGLDSTVALQMTTVRKGQDLFRRRLIGVEKECRLTKVRDLRFVRASHIKPWAECSSGSERVDGNNGLLLTPSADHLFDQGWITFGLDGRLMTSNDLPSDIVNRLGIDLRSGRDCGGFNPTQQKYLEFHKNAVFMKKYARSLNPREKLLAALTDP